MGIKINGVHSDTFDVAVRTISMPLVAEKKVKTVSIDGVDGDFIIENGYKNKFMELEFTTYSETLQGRLEKMRKLTKWITSKGTLVHDGEPLMNYTIVKTTNDVNQELLYNSQTVRFNATFELLPFLESNFDDNSPIWETCEDLWDDADFKWQGLKRDFTVSIGDEIVIENIGDVDSYPLIKLTGVANTISIGSMSINNLDGIIFIDGRRGYMVVYDELKNNKISSFSGDFLKLLIGENPFTIGGDFQNTIDVSFEYVDMFI